MKINNFFTLHKINLKFFKKLSSTKKESTSIMPSKQKAPESVYQDVTKSVVNLVDFIKSVTSQNLIEASRSNMININENELDALNEIVNASITQGMTTGFREIEGLVSDLDTRIANSSKNSKSTKRK